MKINLKFFSNNRTAAKQEIRKLRDEIKKLKKVSSLLNLFSKDKVSKVEQKVFELQGKVSKVEEDVIYMNETKNWENQRITRDEIT